MRKAVVLAATLAVALSGCVSAPAPGPSPSTADASPTPSVAPSNGAALRLAGSFVSQGAATQGTVTITELSDAEIEVTLSDFSTGAGDDLRLNLSPGSLEKNADGYYVVADGLTYELAGKIDPDATEQVFVFSLPGFPLETIRSFTVYDYAGRTAFGSAALE